ncbi:MAG: ATP-binding protein [Gammaproteobacteria bacterium]|nr:ATP-binding protein [Gammaproteobacteria bacterium]MYJ76477.1 ATP-binding protein [Gammaproteobacteria bacterium]
MWIDRQIEDLLRQRAATRPVVVLTGARQTGKTSLMRRLFPDHGFVSLDLPSEAEQAELDPGSFLARHSPPVIVDEVQYAPGLFRHLKTVVDADRRNGAFLLTGSQPLRLMRSVSDSLAGRADILELEPLTFAEAKAAYPDLAVEEFLVRGGFPELYEDRAIDARGFLQSYVATYLERDLRQLLEVSSLRDYERFLRASALRSAQLVNRSDLARDVGVAGSTLASWLGVLEASHQLVLLEPWYGNPTTSLVKRPKLYLRDAGLAAFLCGVYSVDDLRVTPLAGALWETLVCAEIRRSQSNRHGRWNLYFWQDRAREADFLVQRAGRFHLADAKWTERPRSRDAASLRKVLNVIPVDAVESLSVVCRTRNAYPLTDDVEAVPLDDMPDALLGN